MRGRKPKQQSREAEICAKLAAWKRMPKDSRPSLRALARTLGVPHQLLSYYLKRLPKWEADQCWRRAAAIRAQAHTEGRPMTSWEEQEARSWERKAIQLTVTPVLARKIEEIEQEAQRGPLHPAQFKTLKIFAKIRFPGANELLEKLLRGGLKLKKKKPFAEIVRETPQRDGETVQQWIRRIRIRCEDFDTKRPMVLSVEYLQRLSRSHPKTAANNLPVPPSHDSKSFRSENDPLATPPNQDAA